MLAVRAGAFGPLLIETKNASGAPNKPELTEARPASPSGNVFTGGILGEKEAENFRTPATICVTHTTVRSSTRIGALASFGVLEIATNDPTAVTTASASLAVPLVARTSPDPEAAAASRCPGSGAAAG